MSTQVTESPGGPTVPEDSIANRLMLARGRMSIRRASLLCGIGRGTWQNWENGLGEPRLSQVQRISDELNVRFDWLAQGGPLADPKRAVAQPTDRSSHESLPIVTAEAA